MSALAPRVWFSCDVPAIALPSRLVSCVMQASSSPQRAMICSTLAIIGAILAAAAWPLPALAFNAALCAASGGCIVGSGDGGWAASVATRLALRCTRHSCRSILSCFRPADS